LAKRVNDRLFFAGEAVAHRIKVASEETSFAQTAGGAVISGWNTADEVNKALSVR
jgi:monoamine oxidase